MCPTSLRVGVTPYFLFFKIVDQARLYVFEKQEIEEQSDLFTIF